MKRNFAKHFRRVSSLFFFFSFLLRVLSCIPSPSLFPTMTIFPSKRWKSRHCFNRSTVSKSLRGISNFSLYKGRKFNQEKERKRERKRWIIILSLSRYTTTVGRSQVRQSSTTIIRARRTLNFRAILAFTVRGLSSSVIRASCQWKLHVSVNKETGGRGEYLVCKAAAS